MSGLEILQAIIRSEFSHPTIACTVPMQFLEADVINLSGSLGVSEGALKDESGKLYAHATCTCMIIRK